MRVLVLGGSGMLGHQLLRSWRTRFDLWCTLRSGAGTLEPIGFPRDRVIEGVSAENFDSVLSAVAQVRPDAVVNCIGIIKQHPLAKDKIASIQINSLFPHRLARLCRAAGVRMVHVSTDCVFSGKKGNYRETDQADAEDLYGRSKFEGEVDEPGCVTIRSSIIGHEMGSKHGLLEWFLAQDGRSVRGYRRAIFSGLPTVVMGDVIAEVLERHPQLQGMRQVAADPIPKFDLLHLFREQYGIAVNIDADESVAIDRSLDGGRFHQETGWKSPPWPELVARMRTDARNGPYGRFGA